MKQLLLSLILAVFSMATAIPEAEAKRLGGGSSFGMQRQITPTPAPRQPATAQQTQPKTQPATTAASGKPRSSWMGPLAGLAAGLGLAALFSHLGLSEEFGSLMLLMLLAGGAFMIFRMLSRRPAERGNQLQFAGAGANLAPVDAHNDRVATPLATGSAHTASALPDGFDAAAFAREAKVQFIRLQAANDTGDLDDIRAFTTPEVFAEVRMQLAERTAQSQRTDVLELDAAVLELVEEAGQYIVSVRFNGLLREEAEAAPAPFDEIWHLVKPVTGNRGWLIAGIQQVG